MFSTAGFSVYMFLKLAKRRTQSNMETANSFEIKSIYIKIIRIYP